MAVNTLDELSKEGYDKAAKAIEHFRKTKKSRNDQHVLYDELTNVGLSPESADEYINLEIENA
jgi:hypothetical protein